MSRRRRTDIASRKTGSTENRNRAETPALWRSLEERAQRESAGGGEGGPFSTGEFPPGADQLPPGMNRREFLARTAATFALAGVAVCSRQPLEEIVPYVKQPEGLVQGRPLYFATSVLFHGHAQGAIVESHEGRPTKVEGNPDHPSSLGGTSVFGQAAVLDLYDPDRSQSVLWRGEVATWPVFLQELANEMERFRADRGKGLRLLTGVFTSPTLLAQIRELKRQLPEMHWHAYDPVGPWPSAAGATDERAGVPAGALPPSMAAGPLPMVCRFDAAAVVVALDSDFLYDEAGSVRYARDFAARRRVRAKQASMNRLYVAEPMPTVTGVNADHRLRLRPSQIVHLARALAARAGVAISLDDDDRAVQQAHARWIEAAADDLRRHAGEGLVVAGCSQPPAVHQIALAMNQALGNVGRTLFPIAAPAPVLQEAEPLDALAPAMDAREVEALVILDCNPVYDAPADLEFARRLQNVRLRIHHGLWNDETGRLCDWHLPATHEFEMWSDARAHDGTAGIIQPLIAPLYEGRPHHELLAALSGLSGARAYELVRAYWREHQPQPAGEFEQFWRRAVHDGFLPHTTEEPLVLVPASLLGAAPASGVHEPPGAAPASGAHEPPGAAPASGAHEPPGTAAVPAGEDLELVYKPDSRIWDGRYANNVWLEELPRPVSQLTWDNAAILGPETAARLRLANEEVVELRLSERRVEAPVWIVPGVAEGCVVVHLGYGRTAGGRAAEGAGFNAYRLRTSSTPWFAGGLAVRSLHRRYSLVATQDHQRMEGRDLLRHGTLSAFHAGAPELLGAAGNPPVSLYPPVSYEGYRWGMNIDLTACIGCGVCTIACQAENNIPAVGKEQVRAGREMHWIRVDRYFEGPAEDPDILHQPVPCMQCENAPCEVVCPVGATVHSTEGLNEMVYNRCVGTRYCSNNCPYKVRRFNFFDFTSGKPESYKLQRNPDVSVRSRGVMEKCTYCIQRIEQVRIASLKEDRPIGPNEIVTACQAACPTQAIVFGDLGRGESLVAALAREPHNYGMLAELNTRPRTTYLARLRNPHPGTEGA